MERKMYFVLMLGLITLIHDSKCLLQTRIIPGELHETITLNINKSIEYIIDYYNENQPMETVNPLRIHVESNNSQNSAPIMVVVRQKQAVLSWKLPLIVNSGSQKQQQEYMKTEQTLCYDGYKQHVNYRQLYYAAASNKSLPVSIQPPYVTISTLSDVNVSATLNLDVEESFYILPNVYHEIAVSPSTPRFYYYGFPQNLSKGHNYDMVTVRVHSDSDVCMTVSIQNYSCPILDLNDDVTFKGSWQTVSREGGLTINRDNFQNGFFIVFVVKGDDYDCTGKENSIVNRTKKIKFAVLPTISYDGYSIAVIITLACICLFYIVFGVSLFMCNRRCYVPRTMDYVPNTPTASSPGNPEVRSLGESDDYDTLDEAESQHEIILTRPNLYVSDLSRRNHSSLIRKSYSYFWHVLTVALFYFLPVIQLVITYQKVLHDTGNQDLCFYNFYCARPFGFFSDFNHIFSNIGYVSLGLLFIFITHRREQWHKDSTFDRNYGLPHHYGLFYAIGFALVMEGVLSGSYHVCPNHSNFQFDTSFMYITAVLCMIKIYHTRHPDVNASAYSTFGVLAVAILLGMIGILEANLAFWIFFTILHISGCFYLTIKIYYLGCCNFDRGSFQRVFQSIHRDYGSGILNVIRPMHKSRMVLLLIGNLLNWILAALGILYRLDFALYLLALFMLNTVYYFIFYIIMKLLHKERITSLTLIFLVISLTCAATSMYCFLHKSIAWSETSAQSRTYNQDCILLNFYDFHDIWHFLSAIGMFFMFMVLLTLDDDLSHTPRTEIPVF
ncbi:sid1 transmembrane family memeber [Holotrichia oblita]|uniref:Sid1 transmembrane family memeber n=1 Tax=Holotrichia oblita TaxID=644536 RepID=A0ACB9SHI2_HOLOL|nr:sid1 transmembrane family memeber [Holotrichia oblita]